MTSVIWKYPLTKLAHRADVGYQLIDLEIQEGFEILSVQEQGEWPAQEGVAKTLCLWALVDPDANKIPIQLCLHTTGYEIEHEHGDYHGTVLMYDGRFVVHIFGRPV